MRSIRLWLVLGVVAPTLAAGTLLHVAGLWYAATQQASASSIPLSRAVARLVSVASRAAGPSSLLMYRGYVAQATVLVLGKTCTGFIADEPDLVVTAAHCVPEDVRQVTVLTAKRKHYVTRVIRIDRNSDFALLRLPRPLDVPPLPLATKLPSLKEPVLFVGRSDRPGSAQVGDVKNIGRCPSLPHVPHAIFTSIDAQPGDSGAPVLDSKLEVVGIIHGGARCHILAPVAALARQLQSEAPDPRSRA